MAEYRELHRQDTDVIDGRASTCEHVREWIRDDYRMRRE
jgi:hypothetical protein